MQGGDEARHFLHGIRHQHGLEVVAVFQSRTDAGGDGIDVFQHRRILDSKHVGRDFRLDEFRGNQVGESTRFFDIGATNRQVGKAFQSDFLGVGRTSDAGQILIRNVENLMEIFRNRQIFVGHDSLDGGDDEFVAKSRLEFFQMAFQVGRRRDEDERVVGLGDFVEVRRELNLIDIEAHARQIGRVVAEPLKVLDAVRSAHIPPDVMRVLHHNLGNGRCPRTAADDCYFFTQAP